MSEMINEADFFSLHQFKYVESVGKLEVKYE